MKGSTMSVSVPPRWDLTNVYPGLDSAQFEADIKRWQAMIGDVDKHLSQLEQLDAATDPGRLTRQVNELLDEVNRMFLLGRTLSAYINSFVTTDSFNTLAARKESEYEKIAVESSKVITRVRAWIGKIAPVLRAVQCLLYVSRRL